MRLAIVDIDGTLVPGASSEARFARFLWQRRALGPRQLLAYIGFCIRYLPRFGTQVLKKNKAYLSGHSEARIATLAREFVAEVLMSNLHPATLERLQAHRAAGDVIVLLSGTPQFIARALAEELGAADCMGAACTTENGYFTMAPPRRHPFGPTKVDAAETLAAANDLSLEQAIAYGDSISDAYLFRVVGEAVAVDPDRWLSAAAEGAGWEILMARAEPF